MAASDTEHVAPVYGTASSLPAAEEKRYSVNELCSVAEKTAGIRSMEGAQWIGGLWRLYPPNNDARVALLTKGIVLRGVCVTPRDNNPFIVTDDRGNERETPATKLTIGNVPIFFSNMRDYECYSISRGQNLLEINRRAGQRPLRKTYAVENREKIPVHGGTGKTSSKNSAHQYIYRQSIPQGAESPYMQQLPVKRTPCKRLRGTDQVQTVFCRPPQSWR